MVEGKAVTCHPIPSEETEDDPSLRQGAEERVGWHFVSPFKYLAWLWYSSGRAEEKWLVWPDKRGKDSLPTQLGSGRCSQASEWKPTEIR